jgi:hypothetical protein
MLELFGSLRWFRFCWLELQSGDSKVFENGDLVLLLLLLLDWLNLSTLNFVLKGDISWFEKLANENSDTRVFGITWT